MTVEQAVGHELEWRQPEVLSRFYQLTDNGREIATLRFESSCGSLATGECGQARWTFKRTGFLSPKISVAQPAPGPTAGYSRQAGWAAAGWSLVQAGAFTCGTRISGHRMGVRS